jgi:uncharacterized protein YdeI (YjbR/CyaY-like superfamily)
VIPGLAGPTLPIQSLAEWQEWFATHSASCAEIWAVILKKSTGRQTVTYEELLREALCWGWVDVKTKRVDDERYGIRFVPRRLNSNWTAANREIACELIGTGRMQPTGRSKLPADLDCP